MFQSPMNVNNDGHGGGEREICYSHKLKYHFIQEALVQPPPILGSSINFV